MKNLILLLALAAGLPVQAFDWQAKTDTIWPARHYRELNGSWSGDRMSRSSIDWNYPEGTVVVYGIHFPTGNVRADALFQAKSGQQVTFGVRIVHPASGTVVLEHSVTSTQTSSAQQRMEIMPATDMPFDGWYRFELTCPGGAAALGSLNLLLFQRESALNITDSEIFMAPSVHLWWSSTVPGAPSGQAYDWTYLEVMYPQEHRQVATYQMAIGTDVGYSGIQMPTRADGSFGNSVLFSVWDNGDVEKDRNLPEHMRSAAVDVGPGAYATRFGGEGTGSSIRFTADTLWKFDHWIQFLLNERPEHTQVTTTDASGKTQLFDYQSTLQSMWYKMADEPSWHYIGTLRVAGADRLTSGIYSFLENFGNGGGEFLHRCYFRNGAMRSAASGKWFAQNKVGFGNTQNNGKRESRYDFGHGLTGLFENTFYLETGGYLGTRDSAATYTPPAQGQMPWVDTIDIDRLNSRIDLAVTRNHAKTMLSALEAARTVSDPTSWTLLAFSDQETEGEGENGRAAFILDGNTTTYYHNKWKNGAAAYPHTFTFDAGQQTTVSSIELYQGRDSGYRARQMQLYTSDDANAWKLVANRLNVMDSDHPTVELDSAVTARYFRVRFTSGYGSNLVINEIYFKHDYRSQDLLTLAERLFGEEDHFGGYAPADLAALHTATEALRNDAEALSACEQFLDAFTALTQTALPLTYSIVGKAEHLSAFCAYQLHNLDGRGDLVATTDGQLYISGSTTSAASADFRLPTSVTSPHSNWLILYSATFKEYYLYNIGARKFLSIGTTAQPELSDTPVALDVHPSANGFLLGVERAYVSIDATKEQPVGRGATSTKATLFELRCNYALKPANAEVLSLVSHAEMDVHQEVAFETLCQQAIATYSKAFVTTMDASTKLIRSAAALTSNVNSTQQEQHNLAKLVDGKVSTYWESWYSNIAWPSDPGYVQARLITDVPAFYLTFTPSQHPQYGQPDIPQHIRIYTSPTPKDFSLVKELTEGLPTETDQVYTSPVIFSGQPVRNVRVEVLSTIENRDNGRVFAMSEMQMHPAVIDESASLYCQRPWVKEAVDALGEELTVMRNLIRTKNATSDDAMRLQEAIDRAEASYLDPTDIHQPAIAAPFHSGTYDLTGRPIAQPQYLRRGLYVRDGKKWIIR